ncbi:MAG: NUDIX domain-containing protein, partial [Deltaproteobacteria bacterium]
GGKIEPNEGPEECLQRELLEELGVKIINLRSLDQVIHKYPAFTIMLYPFICAIAEGKIRLNEHAAVKWMPPRNLLSLDWAEADLPVLAAYCQLLEKIKSKGSS